MLTATIIHEFNQKIYEITILNHWFRHIILLLYYYNKSIKTSMAKQGRQKHAKVT